MNFIAAILHATIGYGIRRKAWSEGFTLHIDNHELKWIDDKQQPATKHSPVCQIGQGGDMHLGLEALRADDWEAI